jgi:hypothetical protein
MTYLLFLLKFFRRLLKLEDELNKEKNEMRKLLKAKEDLIEMQNRRIESLAKAGYNYTQQLKQSIMNTNYKRALNVQVQQNQHLQQHTDMFKAFQQPNKLPLNSNLAHMPMQNQNLINMNRTTNANIQSTNFIRTSEL